MAENEIICPHCLSKAAVKFGACKGKQLYFCKVCNRKFKQDGTLYHMKTPAKQVASALSMYYEGMSLNAIRRQLQQDHGNCPSDATIYEWITKYTRFAVKETKEYKPNVGSTWVADETVLKIDGNNIWFWDIIDAKTRFLLASHVSRTRTTNDARQLMEAAAKRAGKTPRVIVTDKLAAYLDGIELTFGPDTKHVQSKPFELESKNNIIERFHGTLKARTKVMRGLKSLETAKFFTDGWLVHYNFLRPHDSLKDKSPAEVSGISFQHKNWFDLTYASQPRIIVDTAPIKEKLPKGSPLVPNTGSRPRRAKRGIYISGEMMARHPFKGAKPLKGKII